ncbi:MAG TPA: hypothetical protein PLE25_11325 [Spirochaetales bacterium]|nr:hypothetical protein [Spirochaetales bacterium]
MRQKRLIILVLIAAVASAGLWAQGMEDDTVFSRFPSALGAYVCYPITGGLTYQHWFGRAGLQATIGGIAQTSGSFDYNVQAAFQYMLYGEDFADWFSGGLYTNVLLGHRGSGTTGSDGPSYDPVEYLGLGVGIEMVFLRHLSTSVEFMYVGSYPLALEFGFGGSLKYRF